jgi:hypothetical protein
MVGAGARKRQRQGDAAQHEEQHHCAWTVVQGAQRTVPEDQVEPAWIVDKRGIADIAHFRNSQQAMIGDHHQGGDAAQRIEALDPVADGRSVAGQRRVQSDGGIRAMPSAFPGWVARIP